MLTCAKQVVVEKVCPRVLTEMVDSKYISFFFFLFFFSFSVRQDQVMVSLTEVFRLLFANQREQCLKPAIH